MGCFNGNYKKCKIPNCKFAHHPNNIELITRETKTQNYENQVVEATKKMKNTEALLPWRPAKGMENGFGNFNFCNFISL